VLRGGDCRRLQGIAFVVGRSQTGGENDLMPNLLFTNAKGKRYLVALVSASNSQQPNEIQKRELDQIHRRLPPHILEEMSAQGLSIPPREGGLLLSRLKGIADSDISIGD